MKFVLVFLIIDTVFALVYIHGFIRTIKQCMTKLSRGSASTWKILTSNPLRSLELILSAFVPIFNIYESYVFTKCRDEMADEAIYEVRTGGVV